MTKYTVKENYWGQSYEVTKHDGGAGAIEAILGVGLVGAIVAYGVYQSSKDKKITQAVWAAINNKNYDEAVSKITQLIERHPDDLNSYILRGGCYLEKNDLGNASRDFSTVIRLQPNNDTGYYWLGKTMMKLGDFEQALLKFKQAIEIEPNSSNYQAYGCAYAALNQYDEARKNLSFAIELEPSISDNYKLRAEVYRLQGDEANYRKDHEAASCASWITEMSLLDELITAQTTKEAAQAAARRVEDELKATEPEWNKLEPLSKKENGWKFLGFVLMGLTLFPIHIVVMVVPLLMILIIAISRVEAQDEMAVIGLIVIFLAGTGAWLMTLIISIWAFIKSAKALPKNHKELRQRRQQLSRELLKLKLGLETSKRLEELYSLFGRDLSSSEYIAMRDKRIHKLSQLGLPLS